MMIWYRKGLAWIFGFVILQEKLEDILSKATDWWGTSDKDIYDNLIFVMSPATAEIIAEKIGEPTKELEQICICDNTIFWSFDRNKYCGFGKSRKIIFYREQKLPVLRRDWKQQKIWIWWRKIQLWKNTKLQQYLWLFMVGLWNLVEFLPWYQHCL